MSEDAAISIALRLVDQATAPMTKAMAMVDRATGAVEQRMRSLDTAANMVKSALGGVLAGFGVQRVIETADQYQNLHGRLKLVTSSAAELAGVERALYAESQQSRRGYDQTLDIYARVARSTKDLNLVQTQRLAVTDAINKSLIISGSSSESANAAIIQLGQGLQSGTLRGEELNSVLEQAPRLAEAIASGMGVTIGQLRDLGKEGKLTADAVTMALIDQADVINREFEKMPKTVDQAMTVARNTLGKLISGTDQAGGGTAALAGKIIDLAGSVDRWAESNEKVLRQQLPARLQEIGDTAIAALQGIKLIFDSLPDWVVGSAGIGLVGGALFGPKGMAAIIAGSVMVDWAKDMGRLAGAASAGAGSWGSVIMAGHDDRKRMLADLDRGLELQRTADGVAAAEIERIDRALAAARSELDAAKATEKPWYLFSAFPDTVAAADNVKRLEGEVAALQERLAKSTTWKLPTPYLSYERSGQSYVGFDAMVESQEKPKWDYSEYLSGVKRSVQALKPDMKEWERDQRKIADEAQRSRDQLDGLIRNMRHDQELSGLTGLEKSLKEVDQRAEEYKLQIKDLTGVDKKAAMERIESWAKNQKAIATTADEFQQLEKQFERLDQGDKDLHALRLSALPEQQRQLQEIADKYADIDKKISRQVELQHEFGGVVGLTVEQAEELRQVYGVRMQEDIQATTEKMNGEAKVFQTVAKDIHRSFTDFFEKIFDGGVKKISDLGDSILGIFKRIFAQLAALAIAEPVVVPVIGMIGGAMGVSGTAQAGVLKQLGVNPASSGGNGLNTGNALSIASMWEKLSSGAIFGGLQNSTAAGLAGLSATDPFLYEGVMASQGVSGSLAQTIMGMSSNAFGIATMGIGSALMGVLSGQDFKTIAKNTAFTTGGAALGTMLGIGPLLGGIAGGLLGGLFGSSGGPKVGGGAWSDYTALSTQPTGDQQYLTEMGRAAAQLQTTFDTLIKDLGVVSSGLTLGLGYSADPAGDAQTIVSSAIRNTAGDVVWQNSHEDVGRSVEEIQAGLDLEGKKVILAALQSLDISPVIDFVLDKVDIASATKESADSIIAFVQASKDVTAAFDSIGISAQELAISLQAGSIDPAMFGGGVWDMLTEQARQALQGSIDKASADFAAGNADLGTQTLQGVQQYINGVTAITSQISAAIDNAKLSEYELGVRQINAGYDQMIVTLRDQYGVNVDATRLEEARTIALADAAKNLDHLTKAEREAADAAKILADKQEQINDKKFSLENQLLRLTGHEAEAVANERKNELATMDESLRPLQLLIWAREDEQAASEKSAAAVEAAVEAAKAASDGLAAVFKAESDAINHRADAEIAAIQARNEQIAESINKQIDSARESISGLESAVSSLKSAKDKMLGGSFAFSPELSYALAQKKLASSLDAARGGDFSQFEAMGPYMDLLTGDNTKLYSNSVDYQRDYWKTYLSIAEAASLGGAKVDVQQQMVTTLEAQLQASKAGADAQVAAIRSTADDQISALNAQLAALQSMTTFSSETLAATQRELEAIVGVGAGLDRLMGAVNKFAADVSGHAIATGGTSSSGRVNITTPAPVVGHDPMVNDALQQMIRSIATSPPTPENLAAATGQFVTSLRTIEGSFAVGTSYVPRDMTARVHAGEEITPRPYVDAQRDDRKEQIAASRETAAKIAKLEETVRTLLIKLSGDTNTLARLARRNEQIGPKPARQTA